MNRIAIGLLVAAVVVGNVVTIAILLSDRGVGPPVEFGAGELAELSSLSSSVDALRSDIARLAAELASRPSGGTAPLAGAPGGDVAPAVASAAALERFDDLAGRLERLEATLLEMKNVNDELVLAKLREKREEQFRSEQGFAIADELLAEKKYALGANGILTFLEAHPEHPDARDLMRKARDAFRRAGYGEKALWLQNEMMERFPENRGGDLYGLAMLEKQLGKLDEAIAHIDEAVELAGTAQDRMNRLFYRAYLHHQHGGDEVGLRAYREVERASTDAGIASIATESRNRADEIQERLGQ